MRIPSRTSSIGFEIWLPKAGWNGRYQQVGNHGFAGVIQWVEMAPQLRRGYAVAATDDGHEVDPRYITDPRAGAFDLNWAANHPARLEDAAWRAPHVLAQERQASDRRLLSLEAERLLLQRLFGRRSRRHDGGTAFFRRTLTAFSQAARRPIRRTRRHRTAGGGSKPA